MNNEQIRVDNLQDVIKQVQDSPELEDFFSYLFNDPKNIAGRYSIERVADELTTELAKRIMDQTFDPNTVKGGYVVGLFKEYVMWYRSDKKIDPQFGSIIEMYRGMGFRDEVIARLYNDKNRYRYPEWHDMFVFAARQKDLIIPVTL